VTVQVADGLGNNRVSVAFGQPRCRPIDSDGNLDMRDPTGTHQHDTSPALGPSRLISNSPGKGEGRRANVVGCVLSVKLLSTQRDAYVEPQ
jgi:hypothetical protein